MKALEGSMLEVWYWVDSFLMSLHSVLSLTSFSSVTAALEA